MNMTVNLDWECVECCPHCEGENVYKNLDPVECNYMQTCKHCGKIIMLCDECIHADDNKDMRCDWERVIGNDGHEGGKCFRGSYMN